MQILGTVLRNLAQTETKPYPLDLVKGLDRYFDSPEYSDVTIRCCTKDFYAHRIVLASQSKYFADAFPDSDTDPALLLDDSVVLGNADALRRSAPGSQRVLDMRHEDPRVVEGVLCYMYHADYRDDSSAAGVADDGPVAYSPEGAATAAVVLNLRMCAAADRFGVSCLKRCALEKLEAAAERSWDTEGLVRGIAEAYAMGAGIDDATRGVLVAVAAAHSSELGQVRGFRDLLDGVLAFNAEFTEAIVKREGLESAEIPCLSCSLTKERCRCGVWSS